MKGRPGFGSPHPDGWMGKGYESERERPKRPDKITEKKRQVPLCTCAVYMARV